MTTPNARDLLPESEALLAAASYGQQVGWFVMEGQSEWLRAQLAVIEDAARADAARQVGHLHDIAHVDERLRPRDWSGAALNGWTDAIEKAVLVLTAPKQKATR